MDGHTPGPQPPRLKKKHRLYGEGCKHVAILTRACMQAPIPSYTHRGNTHASVEQNSYDNFLKVPDNFACVFVGKALLLLCMWLLQSFDFDKVLLTTPRDYVRCFHMPKYQPRGSLQESNSPNTTTDSNSKY